MVRNISIDKVNIAIVICLANNNSLFFNIVIKNNNIAPKFIIKTSKNSFCNFSFKKINPFFNLFIFMIKYIDNVYIISIKTNATLSFVILNNKFNTPLIATAIKNIILLIPHARIVITTV